MARACCTATWCSSHRATLPWADEPTRMAPSQSPDFDHNEADSLGNATLTSPNPLAGYIELAQQVAKSGVKEVSGNVIIDDRLFQPFNFRGQFDVRPIFVNGDLVDLSIRPTSPGKPASVSWRPVSAALGVENKLMTSAAHSK